MKRPKHLSDIVIGVGFLAYLLGLWLSDLLVPDDILHMSREESQQWWYGMLLRDVGLSIVVFTMIAAGVRALRARGFHCRGVALACGGIGLSLVFLAVAIFGYHMTSKIFSSLFAMEEETRKQVAEWEADGTLDEEQLREFREGLVSYDRATPMAQWLVSASRGAIISWSALLVVAVGVGLILPIRRTERSPHEEPDPAM